MDVLSLLIYAGTLVFGLVQARQAQNLATRHEAAFVPAYRGFVWAHLAYGFVFFVGFRAIGAAVGDAPALYRAQHVIGALAAPLFSLFVFLLIRWCLVLGGGVLGRRWVIAYWALQVVLYAVAAGSYLAFARFGDYATDALLGKAQSSIFLLSQLIGPLCLLALARRLADPVRRRLARRLGLYYLLAYGALTAVHGLHDILPDHLLLASRLAPLGFLLLNLPALAFLDRSLRRHPLAPLAAAAETETAFGGAGLTVREREIVPLVSLGLTNDEIAARLFISTKTVKNNLTSIYRKTGLANRVQLSNRFRG